MVCPKGYYIAIVSTIAETNANHPLELEPGFERLGRIEEKFMVKPSNYFTKKTQQADVLHVGPTDPPLRTFGKRRQ